MNRLEHLDKSLVDELTRAAREAVRDELREQTRGQRRKAALYAGAGAFALYAGAALALAVGLALALWLPDWAAALITAVVLGGVAYLLRNAARPSAGRSSGGHLPSVDGPAMTPPPVTPPAPERPTAPPTVDATHPGGVEPEVPHRWGQ
ncbi:phage holin family protein [Streptomyces sp. NPDC002853]